MYIETYGLSGVYYFALFPLSFSFSYARSIPACLFVAVTQVTTQPHSQLYLNQSQNESVTQHSSSERGKVLSFSLSPSPSLSLFLFSFPFLFSSSSFLLRLLPLVLIVFLGFSLCAIKFKFACVFFSLSRLALPPSRLSLCSLPLFQVSHPSCG